MPESEPLEEILQEANNYFGDLSRKMLDHAGDTSLTSQQKKELISEFYSDKLSKIGRKDVPQAAEKIKRKANELNIPHETVAGFCVSEKLEHKATLFISRDEKLLKTVQSEEGKNQRIEHSDMLKAFIKSHDTDLYNLKSQLNLYKSSSHGFNALKQLADKFDLGDDSVEVAEEFEDLAIHRVNKLESIRKKVKEEPKQGIRDLKKLTEEFSEDSKKISEEVISIKKQQREREKKIEEYQLN